MPPLFRSSREVEKPRVGERKRERESKTGMMSVWDEKEWLEECIIMFIFRVNRDVGIISL